MSRAEAQASRLTSLDAIRGIAACVVVAGHCYFAMPDRWRALIESSPWSMALQPFHNGDAAVVIFFVLSGYVLSLPYLQGTALPYPRYLVRRACRIYIPFAVAVLVSLVLYVVSGHLAATSASGWFNTLWPSSLPDAKDIAGHYLMLGRAPDLTLDPPMWSLVYEMRISVLFPLLIILCRNTRSAIWASIILFVASAEGLSGLGENTHPAQAVTVWATLFWTAEIVPYFLVGTLLCKHRQQLSQFWARLAVPLRVGIGVGICLIFAIRPKFSRIDIDILYLLAAAGLVVSAIESDWLRRFLQKPTPQWLGQISYSVYLIHLPVMLAVFPFLLHWLSFWPAIAASVAMAFGISALMHKSVERPAIRLGRLLASRMANLSASYALR